MLSEESLYDLGRDYVIQTERNTLQADRKFHAEHAGRYMEMIKNHDCPDHTACDCCQEWIRRGNKHVDDSERCERRLETVRHAWLEEPCEYLRLAYACRMLRVINDLRRQTNDEAWLATVHSARGFLLTSVTQLLSAVTPEIGGGITAVRYGKTYLQTVPLRAKLRVIEPVYEGEVDRQHAQRPADVELQLAAEELQWRYA